MSWPKLARQATFTLLALLTPNLFGLASPYAARENVTMLDNFESNHGWRAVNDNVMGGRSQGEVRINNGQLVFEGAINTNGGGFASIRRPIDPGQLINAQALVLRVKSDDRSYRLILQGSQQYRGRTVSYQADFPQLAQDQWIDARIDLNALKPSVFGRAVPVPALDLSSVWSLGIIIADGIDGPFQLHVETLAVEIQAAPR